MENVIIEKLNRIEEILSIIAKNKNIRFAYINENSNELWNGHDICSFMKVSLVEFISNIYPTPDFPKPIIEENNCLSSKWRAGSIITWIKKQESFTARMSKI